jgi:hypothetical protein
MQGNSRSVAAAVTEARGRMHLLRSSTWRRHGCASLAAVEACTFIASYSNDPEDTLHAYSQLALVANDRQGSPRLLPHCPCACSNGFSMCVQAVRMNVVIANNALDIKCLCSS